MIVRRLPRLVRLRSAVLAGAFVLACTSPALSQPVPEEVTFVAADGVVVFADWHQPPASGEPMEGCRPDEVLRHLTTPTMALRPDREIKIESVAAQARELERNGVVVVVSEGGVHGSSMLDPARASGGVETTWQSVLEFLSAHL